VLPEQVLVCNGGKHALYNAVLTTVAEGDEVLLPAPYWVSYPEMVKLAGGTVVELPTAEETGFRVTVDQLERARTERTKMLIFVSPSNPTGAVYPPDEVEAIGRWAAERGVWILTDEIYEHLVYGDSRFSSMPVLVPEIADRCIVVNGVAKTYAMTGWRVGWMIGPIDVTNAAAALQSHATSNVSNVAQAAALAAVSGDLSATDTMREAFDRRRRTMHKLLNEIPGIECIEPEGAFYAFPSLKALLGKSIRGRKVETAHELADLILGEARVAIVPGEGFGAPGYARLSYALGDDDLVEGVGRIADLLS
jgi:aspartate aminotransferase